MFACVCDHLIMIIVSYEFNFVLFWAELRGTREITRTATYSGLIISLNEFSFVVFSSFWVECDSFYFLLFILFCAELRGMREIMRMATCMGLIISFAFGRKWAPTAHSQSARVLQCVAVCCSMWQCVAVCCNALQCVAVCCSVLQCRNVF